MVNPGGDGSVGDAASARGAPGQPAPFGERPTTPFLRLKRPAVWLVALILAATVLFWRLDIRAGWEPPYLNVILQIAVVGVTGMIIAVLAVRGFMRSGNWPVLWLGAGALVYGLAVTLSNAFLQWANTNAAVTVHNLNALVAASLYLLGAFFVYSGVAPREGRAGRRTTALQVYLGSLAVVVFIAAAALGGFLPPFFVQGQGGTPWRQVLVAVDASLFLTAGAAYLGQYRRSKADFLYWSALGLLLDALVLGGTFVTTVLGGPLSWLARGAQLLGGLYLLVAVLVTLGEARARNMPPSELLASFFWRDEASLKLLFESIMDAIVVTDRRFVITDWNQAAEAVYGWKAEEVVGKPAAEILRSAYASDGDRERAQEALAGAGTWQGEVVQRHRSGREVPVLATVSALRDSLGQVVGVVAVNRDISDRVQSERQLRQANARLEIQANELQEAKDQLERRVQERTAELGRANAELSYQAHLLANIGDSVVATDGGYRITALNRAAEELWGWKAEEVIGRLASEVIRWEMPRSERDRARRELAASGSDDREGIAYRRDGSAFHCEARAIVLRDAAGQVTGYMGMHRDITQQKRAQERIAYQARLLENVNDAILAFDADLRITAWNRGAEELYGRTAEEVMGAYAPAVLGSQVTDVGRAAVMRVLAEAGRWQGEIRHTRRDGTPIVVEATIMALRDDAGRIFAHVSVNRDITERKRMEEELRTSREQLQSLSHRLVELQESERYYIANQLYNDEGQRLAALILGLARIQKHEDATPALASSAAELLALADGVLSDMHSLAVNLRPASLDRLGLASALGQWILDCAHQSGIEAGVELSALAGLRLLPKIETNVFRIVQAASTNVMLHAHARSVSVTAARCDDRVTLIVEDDGLGFDVEEAQRRGALGLLGMQERAEAIGGALTVESGPGKGTTVYIEVPINPAGGVLNNER